MRSSHDLFLDRMLIESLEKAKAISVPLANGIGLANSSRRLDEPPCHVGDVGGWFARHISFHV
jgi:hypothetical protein